MNKWNEMSIHEKMTALKTMGVPHDFGPTRTPIQKRDVKIKIDKYAGTISREWDRRCITIKRLHKTQYALYLRSPEWQHKRQLVLNRDGRKCQVCESREKLEVHHLTYARKYNESLYDLVTLCETCHEIAHLIS